MEIYLGQMNEHRKVSKTFYRAAGMLDKAHFDCLRAYGTVALPVHEPPCRDAPGARQCLSLHRDTVDQEGRFFPQDGLDVTLIKRFGGPLNVDIYFPKLFFGGVYVERPDSALRLSWAIAPTSNDRSQRFLPVKPRSVTVRSWPEAPVILLRRQTSLLR